MRLTPSLQIAAALALLSSVSVAGQAGPLTDPIPAKIQQGPLVLEAREFVRAPRTSDASGESAANFGPTNAAYARIQ